MRHLRQHRQPAGQRILWIDRRSAPSASILQVFLVVGGSSDNQHEEVLSSTEILTEGAAAWLQAGSLPRAAFNLRAVSINNSVFVTGTD